MTVFFKKVSGKLSWIAEDLIWQLANPAAESDNKLQGQITIGITTFKDRFDGCLKPLLARMAALFPDCQIVVTANGHVHIEEQLIYMEEIKEYCERFSNVELISFSDPQGLSFLWNLIIKKSSASHVLILNDDINIKRKFRSLITGSGIMNSEIATINNSWSHFIISKDIVGRIGWFDENLSEIGGEDDDYLARMAMHGIAAGNIITDSIARKGSKISNTPRINSYGRDMSKEEGGYSTLNSNYIKKKWESSDQYFDGAVEVPGRKIRYWRLRGGRQEAVNPTR